GGGTAGGGGGAGARGAGAGRGRGGRASGGGGVGGVGGGGTGRGKGSPPSHGVVGIAASSPPIARIASATRPASCRPAGVTTLHAAASATTEVHGIPSTRGRASHTLNGKRHGSPGRAASRVRPQSTTHAHSA